MKKKIKLSWNRHQSKAIKIWILKTISNMKMEKELENYELHKKRRQSSQVVCAI